MPVSTPFSRLLLLIFGGTLAVQAFAFLRQIVIAAAFGVERSMDIYVLVFSVASIAAFSIASVLENASIPMLVSRLEARDRAGFHELCNRVLVLSVLLAVLAAALFMLAVPLFARFIATGLDANDRKEMTSLAPWFLPWVMVSLPYYATGSLLKSQGKFRRFMLAEILVTIVSLALIFMWRPGVHAIAISYGVGYIVAFFIMLPGCGASMTARPFLGEAGRGLRRQIFRLLTTNQVAILGTLADRYLISHMPAGTVSASSYSALITGQVGSLLGFRDAFMVPLSQSHGRTEKLERMVIGLLMLAIPIAAFLAFRAEAIVGILLERGRFGAAAVAAAAGILSIQACALPSSTILLPMYRMLQILDRMRFTGYLLLVSAASTLVVGSILVFGFGLGLTGYLLTGLAVSHLTLVVAVLQLRLAGIRLNILRLLGYASYALAASVVGVWLARLSAIEAPRLVMLIKDGLIFAAVYLGFCALIYPQLRRIVQDMRRS